MVSIEKLKKLKKGDFVRIKGEKYKVENLDKKVFHNEKTGEKKGVKEILLSNFSGNSKKAMKQRYVVRYNEKDQKIEFYKMSQEKEVSPGTFKFKSIKSSFSYKK